jgi:hypothetical protein
MYNIDYKDESTIGDDLVLWRRVHPTQKIFDDNLGAYRPSSQAFQDATLYGTAMSVNIAGETTKERTLKGFEDHYIVAFTAGFARSLKQGVMRRPLPDEPAHADVFGKKTKSVRKQFANQCSWVVPP